MKVAILGGSAPSTPSLFNFFSKQPKLPKLEISLVGRSTQRLQAVVRASRILAAGSGISIDGYPATPSGLACALEGATLVLIQVRVGGYSGRTFDENMPLKYGICGDQDLGPGALSSGLRVWPEILILLEQIYIHAPNAYIGMLSSPVSLLVGAANLSFPQLNTFGICELPWRKLLQLANSLSLNTDELKVGYYGINHFGWFYKFQFHGCDIFSDIRKNPGNYKNLTGIDEFMRFGGFPTPYVYLHIKQHEFLLQQLGREVSRGEELEQICERVFPCFQDGDISVIRDALTLRPAPWYEFAIGPLILELADCKLTTQFFLSVVENTGMNSNSIPEISETPHIIISGKLIRNNLNVTVPDEIKQMVDRIKLFEIAAISAMIHQNTKLLTEALMLHPWVSNLDAASSMSSEILQYNRRTNSISKR